MKMLKSKKGLQQIVFVALIVGLVALFAGAGATGLLLSGNSTFNVVAFVIILLFSLKIIFGK